MVTFVFGKGAERSLPYAHLLEIDRPEPDKLTLIFSTSVISIEGLRLNPVVTELRNHTLAELREQKSTAEATGSAPFIQKITAKHRE